MTIETLNEIKADATALRTGLLDMADKVSLVEAEGVVIPDDVDVAMDAILVNLGTVLSWVEQAITDGTEEPALGAMSAFLLELKEIFEKYSATIETIVSGYGEGYGSPSGLRLTITYENVTDSVEFMKNSLHSADLG